jgi:hypothetical protein
MPQNSRDNFSALNDTLFLSLCVLLESNAQYRSRDVISEKRSLYSASLFPRKGLNSFAQLVPKKSPNDLSFVSQ